MSDKVKKIIKIIVIICILILLFDIGYLIYHEFIKEEEITYFDSINSYEVLEKKLVAVGSNSNNDKGYEKAKITLYDKGYNKIWESLYNNKYNSNFSAVKKDENNYIVVGSYEASKEEHKSSVRSALIAKYDEDGKLISEKSFQVLGDSKFTNLKVVEDGYIVVGQSIYENMTLGLSDKGGAFVIKYDKELNEVWKSNYGGSKSGIYNDLEIVNNYIYTVGKDSSRLGIISKYSLDGEYISTTTYEYTDTLGFTDIVSDNESLFVVGSKKVTEDQNDYDTDALIVKYDLDLNKVLEKTYQGKGMERYNQLIIDTTKNLAVVGHTGIYNKKKSTNELNVFSYDGILAKYNKNLDELLIENYGDEEDDYFTDINQVDDQYLISGYSTFDNSYISKFVTYTKSGKLIGVK